MYPRTKGQCNHTGYTLAQGLDLIFQRVRVFMCNYNKLFYPLSRSLAWCNKTEGNYPVSCMPFGYISVLYIYIERGAFYC